MKHFLFILTFVTGMLTFCACENSEKYSAYPPVWYGFTISPQTVHPGDSVTITACQYKKGYHLNATTYTLTLSLDTLDADGMTGKKTMKQTLKTNYGGTFSGNPAFTFHIPENAASGNTVYATVSFSAEYNNSADAETKTYVYNGDRTGYIGSITSEAYTLYSKSQGSCTFRIAAQ